MDPTQAGEYADALDTAGKSLPTRSLGSEPLGDEQVTIAATAAGLASIPDGATRAFCTVELTDGEYARFRVAGTAAAGTTGHRLGNDDTFVLDSAEQLTNLSIIRDSAATTDGTLVVTYF